MDFGAASPVPSSTSVDVVLYRAKQECRDRVMEGVSMADLRGEHVRQPAATIGLHVR